MRDYKNIKAYQFADDLAVEVYKITKDFPKEELYGLTSQLRRAAVSIPTNIAEGASRQHKRDYLRFLYIARGSSAETEYLLHLSHRLGYLSNEKFDKIDGLKQEAVKTVFGLISSVEKETRFTS
ncbi:MAG: four helix bundle protein [Candidatus Omnitrophota bacterium]|nr:four helix bundle protein [Candidatus Omnitrophota bacterium]